MKQFTRSNYIITILPGIIISFFVMILGIYIAKLLGIILILIGVLPSSSASPVSGIFVAILLGMLLRNRIGLHQRYLDGLKFSLKYILKAGIILLGLRLSLTEALKLGAWGLPLIIICISSGIGITLFFTKIMNQSKRLGMLTASGTGICGVTAIMAISPVIKAKDNEVSYAVANITIFGLVGMILYPYLAHSFFANDPVKAGLFLGTAIHDTAQVTGAALIYDQLFDMEKVVDVATVTKLTRNLFIIAVIPLISYLFYKNKDVRESTSQSPSWYKLIPLFVIGFLLLALLRTLGDVTVASYDKAFGLIQPNMWEYIYTSGSSIGSTYLLGTAMAAVGLSTDFKRFRGLGIKPLLIGFIAAISVGLVSLVLVASFGHLIKI